LRQNPKINTQQAITELSVGEALVSFLDDKGAPSVVERAWILPPASRIGPITPEERAAALDASVLKGHYEQTVDRESAYEKLMARANEQQPSPSPTSGPVPTSPGPFGNAGGRTTPASGGLSDILFGSTGPRGGHHEGMLESAARSAARSVGSGVARELLRGVLGSLMGRKRR
jgi:hypothetical protein